MLQLPTLKLKFKSCSAISSISVFSLQVHYYFITLLFISLFVLPFTSTSPTLQGHTLQVYGNASMGYYYVTIFVGSPPQQQSVIIDTGSGQLAIPCNKCQSCSGNHINPYFDMSKSKSAEYVTCNSGDRQCSKCKSKSSTQSCNFVISYAEGSSLQGIIIKDSIQFESFSQGQEIVASFGCTTKQTNLFLKQQANGIFGLSPKRTSSLLDDMYKTHNRYTQEEMLFSLCLTGNGGVLNIGHVNTNLHVSPQSVKTTFSEHRNLYSLDNIRNIMIGNSYIHKAGSALGIFGIFIDSGSTFTYFPRANYLVFKNQLLSSCERHKQICELAHGQSTLCFHIKGEQQILSEIDKVFPSVDIEIKDKVVKWKPEKYFLMRDLPNREICLGVEALDRFLLGANWMVDRDIVFSQKTKTVEIFSQSDCFFKKSNSAKENEQQQGVLRRYMGQYSQRVQGHKPLSYESSDVHASKQKQYLFIVVGLLFIIIGIIGLFMISIKRKHKNALQQTKNTQMIKISTNQQTSQTSSFSETLMENGLQQQLNEEQIENQRQKQRNQQMNN